MEIVTVESVDYVTWTCSVRPKAKINVQGNVSDAPIITNVPIAVQKAGDSVILLPIKVGDVCLCVFSKHAIDTLLIDEDTVEIKIPRTFDLSDCLLIAGNFTGLDTIPTIAEGEMLIQHESGSYIKFDADGKLYLHAKKIYMTEAT